MIKINWTADGASPESHIIIKYRCVCACVHMCVYVRVCTCAGESGGWVNGVCGGLSKAGRLNLDFLKPLSSNLHFRFLFISILLS